MKRALYLLLGAFAMLVFAELLLRALPVSTSTKIDYYIHPNILTAPPNHRWTTSTGWALRDVQHMKSNNYGFAAEHKFVAGQNAIGLVGDSYVEASMLSLQDRPAAQLEAALGGARPVYAMGGPGSSLLDYAQRIRWAYETLELRDFVVMMESTDASQSLCNSGNVHAHCLKPDTLAVTTQRRPPATTLRNMLRGSALAQYLNSQIKFDPAGLIKPDFWRTGAPVESARVAVAPTAQPFGLDPRKRVAIDTAVDVFVREVKGLTGLRLVFAIDMNRRTLDSDTHLSDEGSYTADLLEEKGFRVVRAGPLFREHQLHSTKRLDVGPHDGHLNAIGVGLLMRASAKALQDMLIEKRTEKRN